MIRSGPILASLAAGIDLPTRGSSPAGPRIARGICSQWARPEATTIAWHTEPAGSFILASERLLPTAEKGSYS